MAHFPSAHEWQELEELVSTAEFVKSLYETCHHSSRPHGPHGAHGPQMGDLAAHTELPGQAAAHIPRGRDPSSSSATAAQEVQQEEEEEEEGWELEFEAMGAAEVVDGWTPIVNADVVQAMAYHIAQLLAKHPEAQSMSPKQLQQALSGVFSTMKSTKLRKACKVGQNVYRYSALAYSALQMYQNPLLIRAVMAALWTTSRAGSAALSFR